MAIADLKGHCT